MLLVWNVGLTAILFSDKKEEPKKSTDAGKQFTSVDYTSDISTIVDSVRSSIVLVEGNEEGSGVIYGNDDDNAYIMTAAALVRNSDKIQIVFDSGASVVAKCRGIDEQTGLALLEAPVDFSTVIFSSGDSDLLDEGEYVIGMEAVQNDQRAGLGFAAVGKPGYGILDESSGYPLSILEADMHMGDASQGSAMINAAGQLIGVIIRGVQGTEVGYTYAVGTNEVAKVYTQLFNTGKVIRGWLPIIGMNVGDMRPYQKNQRGLDLDLSSGVLINSADGTLGDLIRRDDVILAVNDAKIETTGDLRNIWYEHRPGDKLQITLLREGEQKTVEVTAQ